MIAPEPWVGFSFPPGSVQPADVELGYWHPGGELDLALTDAEGKAVPATVRSWRTPWFRHRDPFWYRDAQAYSVLRPARPLAPGTYRLQASGGWSLRRGAKTSATFTVSTPAAPPPARQAPRALSVSIVEGPCQVSVTTACGPVMAPCAHLDVRFTLPADVSDEPDAYPYRESAGPPIEVTWAPMVDDRVDGVRTASVRGLRSEAEGRKRRVRIPAWWFTRLEATDAALRVQVRLIDESGRRGAPATAVVAAPSALVRHQRDARPARPVTLTRRQAGDVARFAAATTPEGRPFFDMLSSSRTPRRGRDADAAFRTVLAQDGVVKMRARLAGSNLPLTADLMVDGGLVHPVMGGDQLAHLLARVSDKARDITALRIKSGEQGWTWVAADIVRGGSVGRHFRLPDARLGDDILHTIHMRDRVEADPIVRAFQARYAETERRLYGREAAVLRFAAPSGAVTVELSSDSRRDSHELKGPLRLCAVGELEPVITAVLEQLATVDARRPVTGSVLVFPGGAVTVEAGPPLERSPRFEGRLGEASVRRIPDP